MIQSYAPLQSKVGTPKALAGSVELFEIGQAEGFKKSPKSWR